MRNKYIVIIQISIVQNFIGKLKTHLSACDGLRAVSLSVKLLSSCSHVRNYDDVLTALQVSSRPLK